MKYIPLPDNEKETINKVVDHIYRNLNQIDKNMKNLTGEFPANVFQQSSDADKITLIAKYLKLI